MLDHRRYLNFDAKDDDIGSERPLNFFRKEHRIKHRNDHANGQVGRIFLGKTCSEK
jgi:hypothetical protein